MAYNPVLAFQLIGIGKAGDGGRPGNLTAVTGVVGSEKKAFFNDPAVQQIFNDNGLDVQVHSSGSWRMATLTA